MTIGDYVDLKRAAEAKTEDEFHLLNSRIRLLEKQNKLARRPCPNARTTRGFVSTFRMRTC